MSEWKTAVFMDDRPALAAKVPPRPSGESKAPKQPPRSPYMNRHLVKQLKALGNAQGAAALRLFNKLPATPKAVVALCAYLGGFHKPMHLSARLRRQRFMRGIARTVLDADSPRLARIKRIYGETDDRVHREGPPP
jgi:hypothetical protein